MFFFLFYVSRMANLHNEHKILGSQRTWMQKEANGNFAEGTHCSLGAVTAALKGTACRGL